MLGLTLVWAILISTGAAPQTGISSAGGSATGAVWLAQAETHATTQAPAEPDARLTPGGLPPARPLAPHEIRGIEPPARSRTQRYLLMIPRVVLLPARAALHATAYPALHAGRLVESFIPFDRIVRGIRTDRYFIPIAAVDPRPGLNVGLRAAHHNPWVSDDIFAYRAAYGGRHDAVFSLTERSRDPWRTPYRSGFSHAITIKYENTSHHPYFGLGEESRRDQLAYYDLERFVFLARLSRAFAPWRFDLVASRYRNAIGGGSDLAAGDRSAATSYPEFVRGPNPEKNWLELTIAMDRRNERARPHRGWQLELYGGKAMSAGDDSTAYLRYGLELQAYAPFAPRHTLAFRLSGEEVRADEGDTLHPTELISLGGRSSLRGFLEDRFIDSAAILASLEYRYAYAPAGELALFFDIGEAMPEMTDPLSPLRMNFDGLQSSFGAGLRFAVGDRFFARGCVAKSSEDLVWIVTLEPEFDREDRRLRR